MTSERRVSILSAVAMLIAAGALFMLWRSQQDHERAGEQDSAKLAPAPWATLDVGVFAAAEVKIERLRKQSSVDWRAIRAEYDKTLPVVRFMDLNRGLTYERDIAAALDQCEKGEQAKVNQQVLAKGLQHVAVLGIQHELKRLSSNDTTDRPQVAERIATLASGIRPTFVRRDKDYFEAQPTLAAALDEAVDAVRGAVKTAEPLKEPRQALMDGIARTYALSVLYEIEQIEKLRGSDLQACEVKRMEAVIFYRILAERVSRRAPSAHRAIIAMLSASPDQMNASLLKSQLQAGLPGIDMP